MGMCTRFRQMMRQFQGSKQLRSRIQNLGEIRKSVSITAIARETQRIFVPSCSLVD